MLFFKLYIKMHPFFSSSFQPFVHRGNSVNFTENTLEAFQAAVNLGYKYIETDLRMTKDGEIVTFHDESIYRVSGEHKNICDLTYAELTDIPLKRGGHIPKLTEVMEQFPDTKFNVDLKIRGLVNKVAKIIDSHNAYNRICIASFDTKRLRAFKKIRNQACISMGILDVVFLKLFKYLINSVDCIQIPLHWKGIKVLDNNLIKTAHSKDLKVHVWTINSQETMETLIDMKVDGIMTDDAELLKNVCLKSNLF
ncbi:MAG: glycerophosphodiester phosphodiesterase family protein [Gammaproteobacteria bacterium]